MKTGKKLFAFVLAILLMFSLCGCDLFGLIYPNRDKKIFEQAFSGDVDYRENVVPFSEMEYARPDVDAMQVLADEISDMVLGNAGRNEVTEKLNDFYALYYNFFTMEELAGIHCDIDVSDSYYFDEYSYCSSQEAAINRMMDEMLCDCANSNAFAYLDSQYFGSYLSEHYSYDGDFVYTDELIELYNRESSLLSSYREVLAEMLGYSDDEKYDKCNERAANIYIDLIKTRKALAKELGYDNYEDYMFYSYSRDYTVDDLEDYIAAVKEYIVPLYKKADNSGLINKLYSGLDELDTDTAISYFEDFVSKMPEQLNEACKFMKNYGLYNISSDENSSDSSYTTYLDNYDAPFMLIKTEGYTDDVLTVAHEFGHFCDEYINYSKDDNLDTTEVMSQSLEYMMLCYLDNDKIRSSLTEYKMLDELFLYVNQTSFYDFEHRAYQLSDEELTVDNINKLFGEIAEEYGYNTDSTTALSWIEINHLFDYPFYVISYCISDSVALSIYDMEQNSAGTGLDMYVKLLNNAADYRFEELLENEGMSSPVSRDAVKNIAQLLETRLGL